MAFAAHQSECLTNTLNAEGLTPASDIRTSRIISKLSKIQDLAFCVKRSALSVIYNFQAYTEQKLI